MPPASGGAQRANYPVTGDSQRLSHSQGMIPQNMDEEVNFNWDGVTIALGALALMSVLCLVPLYVVALGAQFSG